MKQHHNVWTLYVDGASRNNPGPSGVGIYIINNNNEVIKRGYYVGIKTNNQAEYLALLLGLFVVIDHMTEKDQIHIASDSQLLVRQLAGIYRVKQPHLQPLYRTCKATIDVLRATIKHVPREENSHADAMANHGIDSKTVPPQQYIAQLNKYDIFL